MMVRGRGRLRAAMSSMLMATLLAATTSIIAVVGASSEAVAAPPGSQFDPGFIVSDQNFFDYNSMNVAQIQQFLDSKGPATCNGCLRQYHGSTYAHAANPDRCVNAIVAKDNISAAQMIYDVAQACHINPQVLLVTLQKETSLVTLSSPESWRYQRAMGYGCPDGAPCSTSYYGLFIQLYSAASQLLYYGKGNFTWYPVGTATAVKYHPNTACGSSAVLIRNRATAALYYYTPYQPNAASLANLYGTGDSCSSYGNRNFWRLFHDWFGDPTLDSDLIAAADGSGTFLTIGNDRWTIADPALVAAYAPLGPVTTVSTDYLARFTNAGQLGRAVTDSSGGTYFVDGGKRYPFTGCDQATDLGYSCTGLPQLRDDQAALLATTSPLTSLVQAPDGSTSLIAAGQRREVFDAASLTEAAIAPPAVTNLSQAFVDSLPLGMPVVRTAAEIHVRGAAAGTTVYYSTSPTAALRIDAALQSQTDLLASLAGTSGSLNQASIDKLTVTTFPAIFSPSTSDAAFALQAHGRVELATPTDWLASVPELPSAVSDRIPVSGTPLTAPTFVGRASDGAAFLVAGATRTPVADSTALASLAAAWHIPATVSAIADAAVAMIAPSTTAPTPPPDPTPTVTPTPDPTPTVTPTPTPTPTVTPTPTPTATPTPTPTYVAYQVVRGDTVWALARRFGSTVTAIVQENGLNSKALIRVGQTLQIPVAGTTAVTPPTVAPPAAPPAPTYTTYRVVRGDTVSRIARRYHTTIAKIVSLNHLNKKALIRVGQTLKIPNG